MSSEVLPSDVELLERMTGGDREAFALLFQRHQAAVYRFSRQMTGSPEAADDICQDVFIALAAHADGYRPALGSFTTYLYGITRNLVRQRYKRAKARAEVDIDAARHDSKLTTSHDPVHDLSRAETLRAVRRAILQLPIHYREVIVLCELNGVSYEEAAAMINRPVGTIRSRLSRARALIIERCRDSLGTSRAEGKAPDKWLIHTKSEC